MNDRGASSAEADRDELDAASLALTEVAGREATGGEDDPELGRTVTVSVVVANGPLVPTIGEGDKGRTVDSQ